MNSYESQMDPQHVETVLPDTYAAPDVQELGNCTELTLGSCCLFSEDEGRWC